MAMIGVLLLQLGYVPPASEGVQSELRMQAVLSAMRENEALYDDLEVQYSYILEGLQMPEEANQDSIVRVVRDKVRAVWKSPRYYGRVESEQRYFGGRHAMTTEECAFDGNLSRTNYRGEYGSIVDKRVNNNHLPPPHRWGTVSLYQ